MCKQIENFLWCKTKVFQYLDATICLWLHGLKIYWIRVADSGTLHRFLFLIVSWIVHVFHSRTLRRWIVSLRIQAATELEQDSFHSGQLRWQRYRRSWNECIVWDCCLCECVLCETVICVILYCVRPLLFVCECIVWDCYVCASILCTDCYLSMCVWEYCVRVHCALCDAAIWARVISRSIIWSGSVVVFLCIHCKFSNPSKWKSDRNQSPSPIF